jgi:hypothetical protein
MRGIAVTLRSWFESRRPLSLFYIRLAAALDPHDGLLDYFRSGRGRLPRVSAKSGSTVIRCRVMHICLVDDLVDLTYRQPFAAGPAWTGIGLAGSR